MASSQTILARHSPHAAYLMPLFMVGTLAALWLTPLLWGSYEQFIEHSRRGAGWLFMAPLLTGAILVIWCMLTFQRVRHAGVIVAMDDETFTVIAYRALTFRLVDLERAELSDNGRQFSIHLTDGSSHHYGAALWDRPPAEIAAILTAAAQAKTDRRTLPEV